jgi:hypothetical protein
MGELDFFQRIAVHLLTMAFYFYDLKRQWRLHQFLKSHVHRNKMPT